MLESMTNANKNLKWFLRIVGTLIIISALGSMFNIITVLANKIPVLGKIVSGASRVVSSILGICVSLLVIALAWFRFRPILSIILIAIVVALIVFLRMYQPKKEDTK